MCLRVPKTAEICRKVLLSSFFTILTKIVKKKSFLVRSEILEPLVNMLTTIAQYYCSNKENLVLPIPMELFKKLKNFSQSFIAFLKSTLTFKNEK